MSERPFLAFRVWRDAGDGKLYSTNRKWAWDSVDPGRCRHLAPRTESICDGCTTRCSPCTFEVTDCEAGFPTCRDCGYYSYSTWAAAEKSTYASGDVKRFLGVIELNGIVRWAKCKSEKLPKPALRYRSEYVKIVALLPGFWDHDRYNVPEINDDEMRFLEMSGYTLPEQDQSGMGLF